MSTMASRRGATTDSLVRQLTAWWWRRSALGLIAAGALFLVSALAVVYVTHLNRQLYAGLQELQREQDVLESEYEKLLLEQSAWSDYSRVELLTREELVMKMPAEEDLVIVEY